MKISLSSVTMGFYVSESEPQVTIKKHYLENTKHLIRILKNIEVNKALSSFSRTSWPFNTSSHKQKWLGAERALPAVRPSGDTCKRSEWLSFSSRLTKPQLSGIHERLLDVFNQILKCGNSFFPKRILGRGDAFWDTLNLQQLIALHNVSRATTPHMLASRSDFPTLTLSQRSEFS